MDDPTQQGEGQVPQPTDATSVQVDPAAMQLFMEHERSKQNLAMAITGGAAAAVVMAGLWAWITVLTEYQIGFMAIAVGFVVGLVVRKLGNGMDKIFGIAGAALALFGCLLGNLLAACGFVAAGAGVPFMEFLSGVSVEFMMELMQATFSPMDLLFYGIAVYEGYRLSFRQFTEEDLRAIGGVHPTGG